MCKEDVRLARKVSVRQFKTQFLDGATASAQMLGGNANRYSVVVSSMHTSPVAGACVLVCSGDNLNNPKNVLASLSAESPMAILRLVDIGQALLEPIFVMSPTGLIEALVYVTETEFLQPLDEV